MKKVFIPKPGAKLRGSIDVPSDKSITHRAIFFGSLSTEKSVIKNPLLSGDCRSTINCFKSLGVPILVQKNQVIIGSGNQSKNNCYREFKAPRQALDCGNSGTTMRLISGVLSAQNFSSRLIGDASLSRRPMRRILDPLRQMGANISAQDDHAPLEILPTQQLKSIRYHNKLSSAQVKTSILLAGLFACGTTTVKEPILSRDHSERMLKALGVKLNQRGSSVSLQGGQKLKGVQLTVPGDFSSAAFFIVAALIVPGSKLLLRKVNLNPTRSGLLVVLKRMGANIQIKNKTNLCGEPIGDLLVEYTSNLKATQVRAAEIPSLVDEVPVLALCATQASGTTIVRGAQELRVKESNRLEAVSVELSKMGGQVTETADGLKIKGKTFLTGAQVQSYHDHRIAMTLALAAQIADGKTTLQDSECTRISFPSFYQDLSRLLKKL